MSTDVATTSPPVVRKIPDRRETPDRYKWNLTRIYGDWDAWQTAHAALAALIDGYGELRGTLASSPEALLRALQMGDELGQLAYRVWYFPALWYDQDQRDNSVNAHRQEVQILLARWEEAASWFKPELLKLPLETVRAWMDANPALRLYAFAVENLYRQQQHVLDEAGEKLLSYSSRFADAPSDAYAALSTADLKLPMVTLSTGESVAVSYAQYRAILATNRNQVDRAAAFRAYYETFSTNRNTYAALYHAVLQRDWFHAQARGYATTLDSALHGNNIPSSVVENLVASTRAGVAPFQRYHRLRREWLKLESYHVYDGTISLLDSQQRYPYDAAPDWIVESAAPLGRDYQQKMRASFDGGWIDVYENEGKRSGAYSAPVYGVHPYMLLNYNDTLDAVFTLAHEMGHSMHTLLSHERQPFTYAGYTIFVAEVASTLNEALFLEHMLARTSDATERVALLQHAIDNIVGTFYQQVLFADYELQAHRLVEQGKPVTADVLDGVYAGLLAHYYGGAIADDPLAYVTWARIPHFYNSPYYVYQYATCFASAARLVVQLTTGDEASRAQAVGRYLGLLESGGSDYPMEQLKRAGVDLSQPDTVGAVAGQLDTLVSRLEHELAALGG